MIRIGEIELACANLDDGVRVLSERGLVDGLGIKRGGSLTRTRQELGAKMPFFLAFKSLQPFLGDDLSLVPNEALRYRSGRGPVAHGVPAELIPEVCAVWLRARQAGALSKPLLRVAECAEMLTIGLARTGIVALVDEATGFQAVRPQRELEGRLGAYLSDELRRWVRTFPTDYFRHLCRLKGVEFREDMRLPQYFGKLTNDIVYQRLAPGLLRQLKRRRGEDAQGGKLHSWLSAEVGLRGLMYHLGLVVGLMRRHTEFEAFMDDLRREAPLYPDTPGLFDDPADWSDEVTV